jgi:hypothetical protein
MIKNLKVMIDKKDRLHKLVQHSANRGSSHRRKSATSHIIRMVWLYRSPYVPVLKKKGYFPCSYKDYLPWRRLEKGKGKSVPCVKNTK